MTDAMWPIQDGGGNKCSISPIVKYNHKTIAQRVYLLLTTQHQEDT